MSKETNTIELTSRHQLVDLNKKLVNFKIDFEVLSAEKKEFDAVVLNQSTINNYDALDKIEMKRAPGHISGTIVADNNKYENYFIILKSDEPHSVDVTTTVEEIPPKESSLESENAFADVVKSGISFNEDDVPFYKTRGCWFLLIVAVALLLYYFRDTLFPRKTVVAVQAPPAQTPYTATTELLQSAE